MLSRTNTIWCQFEENNGKLPKIKDMYDWIFGTLNQTHEDFEIKLEGFQPEPRGIFMKFTDDVICQELIENNNGRQRIKLGDGSFCNIIIEHAGTGLRKIRLLRLPFEITDKEIANQMKSYGEVESVDYEYWSSKWHTNGAPPKRYKNGGRIVSIRLKRHVPSFIRIAGHRALVTYNGQPKTCSYCASPEHLIAECEKKRLVKSYSAVLQNQNTEESELVEEGNGIMQELITVPAPIAITETEGRPPSNEDPYETIGNCSSNQEQDMHWQLFFSGETGNDDNANVKKGIIRTCSQRSREDESNEEPQKSQCDDRKQKKKNKKQKIIKNNEFPEIIGNKVVQIDHESNDPQPQL